MTQSTKRYTLPRSRLLHGRSAFGKVFAARARKNVGPLSVCARPNDLSHPRFGMSVSRKVGKAVVRNHIKRLLRNAFRLTQHDWPVGYDMVVVVRPHEPAELADYQRMLLSAARALDREWRRRAKRRLKDDDSPSRS